MNLLQKSICFKTHTLLLLLTGITVSGLNIQDMEFFIIRRKKLWGKLFFPTVWL